jgi:hypothetical protein
VGSKRQRCLQVQFDPGGGAIEADLGGQRLLDLGSQCQKQDLRRRANVWERIPGALKQVPVASDGAVRVFGTDRIYCRRELDPGSGPVKQISLGSATRAWEGVSTNDEV